MELDGPLAPPTSLVIFGATGDLARRELLPAVYNLALDGQLPQPFGLVGVAREPLSDEEFRGRAAEAVHRFSRRAPDDGVLEGPLGSARYVAGTFDSPETFERVRDVLAQLDAETGRPLNRCFHLSTPPQFFAPIVELLGEHGLSRHDDAEVRVVIEKPYGTSLAEAQELNQRVLAVFSESQVFRVDHFLGKETVQNVLALRFANQVFEPVWNRNYIEHVQITVAEEIGIEGRAEYYDSTGALRDLVQNHMLQLLCLVAMEPPVDFSAREICHEKVKALSTVKTPEPESVSQQAVRGQFAAGVSAGRPVPGYREEDGVPDDSKTETYVALRLELDNWRWAGVPFYLRTGKRLARTVMEIALTLRPVPHLALRDEGSLGARPNQLILNIDPEEGVLLLLAAKVPGMRMRVRPVRMEFLYRTAFAAQTPGPYERLILDAIRGDQTLFTRYDEVEQQWRICDPIALAWRDAPDPPPLYPAGSEGPAEAASILRPGHEWRRI
jgi:glucose-6-phosphate 1-dehydrogenase